MNRLYVNLFQELYKKKFIQTLWNAIDEKNRRKGWVLKSGLKVPWFFDMRPIGDEPELCLQIFQLVGEMISQKPVDLLVGVEMAAVSMVGGVSTYLNITNRPQRFAYTRPLPQKARTPIDAVNILDNLDGDVAGYGQKNYVEGRFRPNDRIGILDDMATNLGSKIIARSIVLWEAKRRMVPVNCNRIFYFLDRGEDNITAGINFQNEKNLRLNPVALDVNYVLNFNYYLPTLQGVMKSDEFFAILDHQENSKRFHNDEAWRNHLINLANK